MKSRQWESISERAQDLIICMLTVDPKERITCDGVLSHPWLLVSLSSYIYYSSVSSVYCFYVNNITSIHAFPKTQFLPPSVIPLWSLILLPCHILITCRVGLIYDWKKRAVFVFPDVIHCSALRQQHDAQTCIPKSLYAFALCNFVIVLPIRYISNNMSKLEVADNFWFFFTCHPFPGFTSTT